MSEAAPASEATAAPEPVVSKAERLLVAANGAVLIALMSGMATLVIANVFARYVFNHSFVWAEELSRYMMIWVGFLGSGLVLRVGAHIAVDVLQDALPRRAAQGLRGLVVAVLLVCIVAMGWLGVQYVQFAWGQESPILNWNFGLIYLAIPIGAMLMLIYLAFMVGPFIRERRFRRDGGLSAEEAVL